MHLITLRTRQARLMLRSSERTNEIIGGVVARYQELYGIKLHTYIFLGNHYHLVLSDPESNLWRFEQSVNREISRRLNWELRHEGSIWGRRYDDQIAVEDEDALEALLYVTLNGVHHGLAYHPADWPGVNAHEQLRDGNPRIYSFVSYSAYTKAKLRNRKARIEDFTTKHQITLTPLPGLGVDTIEEQWKIIEPLLQKRLGELRKERKLTPGMFRQAQYSKQNPFSKPKSVSRAPRPICYTKSLSAKRIFKEFYHALRDTYHEVSRRFRAGEFSLLFPPHTLKPPLHSVPGR